MAAIAWSVEFEESNPEWIQLENHEFAILNIITPHLPRHRHTYTTHKYQVPVIESTEEEEEERRKSL